MDSPSRRVDPRRPTFHGQTLASGSRDRGQGSSSAGEAGQHGAGANVLATLTKPHLAHLRAVDLVCFLHGADRSGSDFADVALVLAERDRRLSDAESRLRVAGFNASLQEDRIQGLQRLLLRIGGGQSEIGARDLAPAEIRGPVLEPGEIEGGEATSRPGLCFDAGGTPRASPPRRLVGTALPDDAAPAPPDDAVLSSHGDHEVAQEQAVVDSPAEAAEAIAGKGKEPAAVEEASKEVGLCFTEKETWKIFDLIKQQVEAWESEINRTASDDEGVGSFAADDVQTIPSASEGNVDDDDVPMSPSPLRICGALPSPAGSALQVEPLNVVRAASPVAINDEEAQGGEEVGREISEAAGHRITCREVSEDRAQEEEAEANRPREEERPARATKKPRRRLITLRKKEELQKAKEKEAALAKEASMQLCLRSLSDEPYSPLNSQARDEAQAEEEAAQRLATVRAIMKARRKKSFPAYHDAVLIALRKREELLRAKGF